MHVHTIYVSPRRDLLLRSGLCVQKFFANPDVCSRPYSDSCCVSALVTVPACRDQAHLVCTSLPRQLRFGTTAQSESVYE